MKIKKLIAKKIQKPLDQDDFSLWEEVTQDVCKMKVPNKELSLLPKKEIVIRENVNVFEAYGGEPLDYLCPGSVDNVDANTVKRFRRGEFVIEGILDLHGCTTNQAFEKVELFIKNSYFKRKRCVQIITGKGLHREDDIFAARGVLKDFVPQWLNGEILRPLVLLFDYSLPEDGGDGALTILLRRKRDN